MWAPPSDEFWAVIHPLVLLVSWYWVFTVCMGVTLPKTEVTQNYPLFLFAGQLPWLLFSDTVQRSASSVLEQGSPITKTVFSRRNDSHFGISVNPGRPLARPGADGGGLWR